MSHKDLVSRFTTWPDTPSIEAVLGFAKEFLDEPTLNHVVRSAIFASILAHNVANDVGHTHLRSVDKEVSVVATLLHDMAWNPALASTQQFVSKDKRFEVDGANTAKDFLSTLSEHDWDSRRVQLVWDAIALHSTASIAWYKEPEVAITQYAILIDVVGNVQIPLPGVMKSITQAEFDGIYELFPSMKLAEYLKHLACALCMEKPETTYDNFVGFYGEEYVEGFTLKGKRIVDQMKSREEAEALSASLGSSHIQT